jgi:hypothetical protein
MLTPLEQAVASYRDGETEKAIQLLADVLGQNPRDENAWLWMSRCVTEPEKKKDCFEQILAIDPYNEDAIEGLRLLDESILDKSPWQSIRKKWLWIVGIIFLACLVLMPIFFPSLPRLIMAVLGMNNSILISPSNNVAGLDDLPESIPGLDHALVGSYMKEVGVDCQPAVTSRYGYMAVCTGGSSDESLNIYLEILSLRQTGGIYHLLGCVLQYEKTPSEYIAGELLGYLARIPYTDADPERSSAWVKQNVFDNPLNIPGNVSPEAVFGGVFYKLEGPVSRGKCLSIGTEVDLP